MNIKRVLLIAVVLLPLSTTTFAGPKKTDFTLSFSLYSEILGDPDDRTYHCYYAGPYSRYENNIACPKYANIEEHLYAEGMVNGQKHSYRIELPHGEKLPTLLLNPKANQPQPPVNNVFPARLKGKKGIEILASRNNKLVTVKALIIFDSIE